MEISDEWQSSKAYLSLSVAWVDGEGLLPSVAFCLV
jgi:hypothetical protein